MTGYTRLSWLRGFAPLNGRRDAQTSSSSEDLVDQKTIGIPWLPPTRQGLYDPVNEHDACGLGFIAHIKGEKNHTIVAQGLQILKNLTHRGATGADPLQGDGAGILIQLPDAFLRRACGRQGMTLPAVGQYGVGMVFLPKEPASRMACEQEIERAVVSEGQILLGWRDVPTDNSGLSERTKEV
jgi:glutamate synthase domain-containing protein 1